MSNFIVAVEGLNELDDIERLDEKILQRARQAINSTLRKARTLADRDIRDQVAFPARYLGSRLTVSKFAQGRQLEGTVTGRDKPTSLARFAANGAPGKRDVSVQVAPGVRRRMRRAFLMKLKGGNIGLAIRLKNGESLKNKKFLRQVSNNLYLLYGPSVNQVFAGVAEDNVELLAATLQQEFNRLMELD